MRSTDEKMKQFISTRNLKVMYGEMVILLLFIFSEINLLESLLFSTKNQIEIFNITISSYYIFPEALGGMGLIYLIPKHILIYRKVITSFILKENKITFFVLGRRKEMNHFKILTDKNNTFRPWTYWDGFTKKKVQYIIIRSNDRDYILPYVNQNKDELFSLLANHGGKLIS